MACERPPFLDGCALWLDVSRYRAHASRGLARAPPAVCAASDASRHLLTGAATPPLGGGEHTPNNFGCGKAALRILCPFVASLPLSTRTGIQCWRLSK